MHGVNPEFCAALLGNCSTKILEPFIQTRTSELSALLLLYTMTAMEIFCPKSILDKPQFQVPRSKNSEKI